MSSAPLSFFTIDLGTASTAVALIAPCADRFRLLASAVAPAGTDLEALLEDVVARVEATEPGLLHGTDSWRSWARLVAGTSRPRRAVCAAATEAVLADLERAFLGAGWEVAGRILGKGLDPLAATELCLDPGVAAIVMASSAEPGNDERAALPRLTACLAAAAWRRGDVPVLLCGPETGWGGDFPPAMVRRLPGPVRVAVSADSALRDALASLELPALGGPGAGDALGSVAASGGPAASGAADGRLGLRRSTLTLAALLDRRVEAVDIGASAGSRTLASPGGEVAHLVAADAALVPSGAVLDDHEMESLTRWSTIRSDPDSIADRFRNLRLEPWRDVGGDGGKLRMAALRSALSRLDSLWRSGVDGRGSPAGADLLICCGGAFAALPPPAAALAVVDGMRRPGALTLFHDHARLLGPVGTLPDEGDRRRLLVDLLDDVLLPLGSAIVAGELRSGARHAATLRVTSQLLQQEIELESGALRLVDLPPGVPARVEVQTREGSLLGVRARKLSLDVTGGLGGLLVDTREVPLKLPERSERRRALLEAWERPVWAAVET